MKLSFVIPAYNEESYLGRCLESIIREIESSGRDAEIIVVNNASTDGTRAVAASYPPVTVVDEPRKGIVKAREAGYLAAKGDLIANIDADNMLPEGWLERVFREFSKSEKLAALSGPLIYYDLSLLYRFQTRAFYVVGYFTYLLNHFILRKGGMLQGGNFILRKIRLGGHRRLRHQYRFLWRRHRYRQAHAEGGKSQVHLQPAHVQARDGGWRKKASSTQACGTPLIIFGSYFSRDLFIPGRLTFVFRPTRIRATNRSTGLTRFSQTGHTSLTEDG